MTGSDELILHIHPLDPPVDAEAVCWVEVTGGGKGARNLQFGSLLGIDAATEADRLGRSLLEKVCEGTVAKQALDVYLGAGGAAYRPLWLDVAENACHALAWETMRGEGDYLALSERWPIVRIPRGEVGTLDAPRPFRAPLHLVCVLSAVGEPALEEWEGIERAVRGARDAGLEVKVTAIAGEDEVLDAAKGTSLPAVTAMALPPATADAPLVRMLEDLQPHLLHLYCHGAVRDGVRQLEFGVLGDHRANRRESSVVVQVEELAGAVSGSTWCVVLNACRGAAAEQEGFTHAETLVQNGVPAAVGMRKPIAPKDAHVFAAHWYPRLFEDLAVTLGGADEPRVVRWTEALREARRNLRNVHATEVPPSDAWAVPILYQAWGAFTVDKVDGSDGEDLERRRLGAESVMEGLARIVPGDSPLGERIAEWRT